MEKLLQALALQIGNEVSYNELSSTLGIDEESGKLFGFEFKWKKDQLRVPKVFSDAYPESKVELINKSNHRKFTT